MPLPSRISKRKAQILNENSNSPAEVLRIQVLEWEPSALAKPPPVTLGTYPKFSKTVALGFQPEFFKEKHNMYSLLGHEYQQKWLDEREKFYEKHHDEFFPEKKQLPKGNSKLPRKEQGGKDSKGQDESINKLHEMMKEITGKTFNKNTGKWVKVEKKSKATERSKKEKKEDKYPKCGLKINLGGQNFELEDHCNCLCACKKKNSE